IRDFHVTGVQTCALPISMDYFFWIMSKMLFSWYYVLYFQPSEAKEYCICRIPDLPPSPRNPCPSYHYFSFSTPRHLLQLACRSLPLQLPHPIQRNIAHGINRPLHLLL